jgi:hypothetical protein
VPSLNLEPCVKPEPTAEYSWRNSKKIESSPYKKFVDATQKKKSKRSINPKPIGLRRMLFLVFRKDGREGFAGIQLRLSLLQIRALN